MNYYTVEITDQAMDDLDAIHKHISEVLLNPDAADRLYDHLLDEADSLEFMPQRIKLMDTHPEKERGYRMKICGDYLLIFFIGEVVDGVDDDVVRVISIFYGASDFLRKLRER